MTAKDNNLPIVSKMFCSSSEVVLEVRRRPHVVYGGGFVVTDSSQKVVFRVDGCGVTGKKGDLILRDGNGDALILICRKAMVMDLYVFSLPEGGIVEALNVNRQWMGYSFSYEGSQKLVFSLKEPNSYLVKNNPIRISIEHRGHSKDSDFEIKGYFPDKACSIVDSTGYIIAQVAVKQEVEELMTSKYIYQVTVKPGIDQAFVFGVVAVLDYIYDGSTRC